MEKLILLAALIGAILALAQFPERTRKGTLALAPLRARRRQK